MTKLRMLEKSLNIINCLNLAILEIKRNIHEVYTNYLQVKKEAKQHRLNYLEQKAQDIVENLGTDATYVYKELI